ncbi:hypothetical protein BHE90_014373 [Fusarium euwallaceae]|uniref:Beta-lactamase-related domain-containing protein n=1 Tax=Fusarium euwallaceae TaxID=1147111 RepID=A0A430L6C4_9HYPO|nr:hypothetical protein BHE90_014373 [Fusarium euwallaceae]
MPSINDILGARTALDADDIFGAVVAVADKTGRLVFSGADGRRTWNSTEPPDLDTTYWAYSFTKLLTTIAALQCVESGQIGLDDAVEDILPELKDPEVISRAGTSFALRTATKKITLRQLLTHTSGVGYDAMSPLLTQWRESRGESSMAMCGDVVKAYSMPLLFEPGESWAYGGGLDWVGQLIERINGQKLGEFMERGIFARLGMKTTTFNVMGKPDAKLKLMDMSVRTTEGKLAPMDHMYPENAEMDSGGMGIVTSVGDFICVVADLIKDEPRLLQAKTRDQMFKPQFDPRGKQAEAMMAMGFLHENLTGGEKSLGAFSFGLGGLITAIDTPNLPAGTLSWGGMPNLAWLANKELGIAACYGCQMMPPADANSASMLAEFTKEAFKYG